jgi:hypothetical protein
MPCAAVALIALMCASGALPQQPPQSPQPPMDHSHMPGMQHGPQNGPHPGMQHGMHMNRAGMFLMNLASGTSMNPLSWPMPMMMIDAGSWNLMLMGNAFLADTQQTGPRGGDKLFSTNWFMTSAAHAVGSGTFMLRTMISLEPATITGRLYPELFQTGETAFGRPIVDGQHPHNLIMDLGVHYARPAGENTMLELYYAPVGDPALGPVAYPHRASAFEIPQAPLGHHWQDSTHIAANVLTGAVKYKQVRLEVSGFYGTEPGENRWTIDWGPINSYSARLSVFPSRNWMIQVSAGRLARPERESPGDVVRSTASVHYTRPMGNGTAWSSSLIWGRNHNTFTGRNLNSYLAETVVPVRRKNFFTGRFELVDKDELFAADPDLEQHLAQTAGSTFRIGEYIAGYTRDVSLVSYLETGVGANVSAYSLPAAIKPFYGSHPMGVTVFVRVRLRPPK